MTGDRVVISGIGAVGALGNDPGAQWRALLDGESGVGPVEELPEGVRLPEPVAGAPVGGLDPREWVADRKALRAMNRHTHMAFAAAGQALRTAGLVGDDAPQLGDAPGGVDPHDVGIMFATAMIDYDVGDLRQAARRSLDDGGAFDIGAFCRRGWQAIYPLFPITMLNNAAMCQIAMQYDIRGPNAAFSPFGEAGAQAIGAAVRALRHGDAKVVLAGGVAPRLSLAAVARLRYLGVLAEGRARPFDRGRTGLAAGEGAAVLVLETLEHARSRGAAPLAEVLGYGSAVAAAKGGDAYPDQGGIERSMRQALDRAGGRVPDHVYADASGLRGGDAVEAAALAAVLPDAAVTSVKGATGHLLAGAMPLSCVFAVQGLKDRLVPPIADLDDPDDLPLDLVRGEPRRADGDAVACLAAGFQGQSTCLILGRT